MKLARWNTFVKDTRGANMVEYIILVGVVALLAFTGFKAFGGSLSKEVTNQGKGVETIQSVGQ